VVLKDLVILHVLRLRSVRAVPQLLGHLAELVGEPGGVSPRPTRLNAGVPTTQVVEWAGHSVEVLLRIYAKCIVGQDETAKRRIAEALREDDP
jgi:hypothetical protein